MGKYIDLTGQTFGKLTVISKAPKPENVKGGDAYWLCRCECGTEKIIMGRSLRNNKTKSCGCIKATKELDKNIGKIYGQLTIIGMLEERNKDGHILYECICSCGNIHHTTINALKAGHVRSCGCLYSVGEQQIEEILINNNINFKKQVYFNDLISSKGGLLRFDFGVYENNKLKYLIEF